MTDWELMVTSVLALLSKHAIQEDQAIAWLTTLVEHEEILHDAQQGTTD